MLMCGGCWALVLPDLARSVYRTVRMRNANVDASWAPWWRAQARAIAHVAFLREPNEEKRDRYLARAFAFADTLENRDP